MATGDGRCTNLRTVVETFRRLKTGDQTTSTVQEQQTTGAASTFLEFFKNAIDLLATVNGQDVSMMVTDIRDQLNTLADFSRDAPAATGDANGQLNERAQELIRSLICVAEVPDLTEREEYNIYEKSEYKHLAKLGLVVFECILDILAAMETSTDDFRCVLSRNVVKAVVVTSLGYMTKESWSSELCRKRASKLIQEIIQLCNCSNFTELLVGSERCVHRSGIFPSVLEYIKLKFTRDNWKRNPSTKHVFKQCLLAIPMPHLSDVLETVLPPSLLLIDDYCLENQIHGIHCLEHIVENITKAELNRYGRSDVIYEALRQKSYTREPRLIENLYPCLLKILRVVDSQQRSTNQSEKPNRSHDVFMHMLHSMEMESVISLRHAYVKQLSSYVQYMRDSSVIFFPRLFRVISEYMETFDGEEGVSQIAALRSIKAATEVCKPRIAPRCGAILRDVLKLLQNLGEKYSANRKARDTIVSLVYDVTDSLQNTCRSDVIECFEAVKGLPFWNKQCDALIKHHLDGK